MSALQRIYGHLKHVVLLGHGATGKGTLPLIQRHFTYDKITVIDPNPVHTPPENQKVKFLKLGLTKSNYRQVLDKVFEDGEGFMVNLSTGTSSQDLTNYCQANKHFYIDTVKELWEGDYYDQSVDLELRTNYNTREAVLKDVRENNLPTTSVSCCGANPGMVSWFVKQGLLDIARDTNFPLAKEPQTREEWAILMRDLGVKGVHIAQRDTQKTNSIRPIKQFWNTWSVDGFISQGYHQASELGWGTHEKWVPHNARFFKGKKDCPSIYLVDPGMNVTVKTWCPTFGPQLGFLVTHDESISISDYFTVRENGKVLYRPTCHYSYHPCQDAVNSALESIGSGAFPTKWKILDDDIVDGSDQLGVLIYGHSKNAYWYGSQLDIHQTRKRVQNQSATTLQVTSSVLAGIVWTLENPKAGFVECNEMDFRRCLQIQNPYISPVRGYYTDWNPLKNQRNQLLPELFDHSDPWQFKNVLIHK